MEKHDFKPGDQVKVNCEGCEFEAFPCGRRVTDGIAIISEVQDYSNATEEKLWIETITDPCPTSCFAERCTKIEPERVPLAKVETEEQAKAWIGAEVEAVPNIAPLRGWLPCKIMEFLNLDGRAYFRCDFGEALPGSIIPARDKRCRLMIRERKPTKVPGQVYRRDELKPGDVFHQRLYGQREWKCIRGKGSNGYPIDIELQTGDISSCHPESECEYLRHEEEPEKNGGEFVLPLVDNLIKSDNGNIYIVPPHCPHCRALLSCEEHARSCPCRESEPGPTPERVRQLKREAFLNGLYRDRARPEVKRRRCVPVEEDEIEEFKSKWRE